jgi:hypothetical protein
VVLPVDMGLMSKMPKLHKHENTRNSILLKDHCISSFVTSCLYVYRILKSVVKYSIRLQ